VFPLIVPPAPLVAVMPVVLPVNVLPLMLPMPPDISTPVVLLVEGTAVGVSGPRSDP